MWLFFVSCCSHPQALYLTARLLKRKDLHAAGSLSDKEKKTPTKSAPRFQIYIYFCLELICLFQILLDTYLFNQCKWKPLRTLSRKFSIF